MCAGDRASNIAAIGKLAATYDGDPLVVWELMDGLRVASVNRSYADAIHCEGASQLGFNHELRGAAPRIPVHEPDPDHIPVELGGVTRFVAVDDITHVEAQGDYARLHTDRGSHLVRIPLSTLEDRWSARGFVRIHRRHLVALRHIGELRLDAGTVSVLVGGEELQVSRRHARELRDLLMRRP